jgi:hypothetical protein
MGVRLLKIFCILACVSCVAGFVTIIRAHLSAAGSMSTGHGILAAIWLLIVALMYAVEFYGIHTKAPFAWKLGWVILAATFVGFLLGAGSAALEVPETDDPRVAFASVLVIGAVVSVYWGFWWKRQRAYFTARSPSITKAGTKELAIVFGIAALVFAGVTLLERQTDKYLSLTNPAVEQFHAQLATGQYAAIYQGADETLRRQTAEADFVSLLQSVHQRLGDVKDSHLNRTGIARHTSQDVTISLNYETKFTYGTGTERFVWRDQSGRVTLGAYQVRSKLLTTK